MTIAWTADSASKGLEELQTLLIVLDREIDVAVILQVNAATPSQVEIHAVASVRRIRILIGHTAIDGPRFTGKLAIVAGEGVRVLALLGNADLGALVDRLSVEGVRVAQVIRWLVHGFHHEA